MNAPFLVVVADSRGEHPAQVYPLSNTPDEIDFLITRKVYARDHDIPLHRAVLVPRRPTTPAPRLRPGESPDTSSGPVGRPGATGRTGHHPDDHANR